MLLQYSSLKDYAAVLNYQLPASGAFKIMHQSIPSAPSHPLPLGRLVSPWSGAFANVALPGGRVFANPWANPELLTRTRFSIRI